MLKLLIILAIAGGGYYVYQKRHPQVSAEEPAQAAVSPNGFQLLPTVTGQGASVLVFAAENCPLEDAARADQLASDLKGAGVPVRRTHDIQFTQSAPDPGAVQRMQAVMTGRLPIVIVNGRGKANPTLAEVVAEYRDGR